MSKIASCFLSVFVCVGLLAATLVETQPLFAAGMQRGGTLTLARPEEPMSLDPFMPSDNGSIYAIAQVCEPLVLADEAGTGLEPGLASSWTTSPDLLTYIFTLRENVKFSDGQPMTSDDVVFSLGKAMDPAASYGFAFAPVKSVDIIDDGHVRIRLQTPYTPLLSALSLFAASIVEKAIYVKGADTFGTKPVCTGPFTVENYERGSQVVLVPNRYYWRTGVDGKPLPYLDKVVLKYIPDNNSRVLELRNGVVDVALSVPLNLASTIQAWPGISLEASRSYRLDYVYLNHNKRPLDDKRIRLAMNYAANRPAIMKVVYFGYGEIPNSFTPKVNYWTSDVLPIPYDLKKASALVNEARYDGTPIHLMIDSGNSPSRQIAIILQAAWTEIGLKVDIVQYDGGTAFDMAEKGDYQSYVNYITSDVNDIDETVTLEGDRAGATGAFFSWYKNDAVLALIAKARQTPDGVNRSALYEKIQDIVYHDGYSVPLNFLPYVNGYKNKVRNWRNIAVGWWWLDQVWLDH
jgi:peptide/nickel transport system substrate-binding protein